SPIRGAFGAILFGATKSLATVLQSTFPEISVVVFNTIPWLLMIAVLLVVGSKLTDQLVEKMPRQIQKPLRNLLRVEPPLALGKTFGE
ncbi:MAG: hypothetical protein OEV06_01715, partial [Anaerolineae bacterium]|nr:hypothetical protein [Anaerolineae bacterium]